ncbi:MAG: (Fe-S)-binding protein [Chloroflexi bacterium]|nr:(Fe-S)-binding protein [Ardenticatenaceae bacterium]MBL1127639.1 (Fe-S)-binding protein [Chloroflexota bacterium]NOG33704.1 (Fe-S)-binding protein [Chloroflexota bacterium]GIK56025.1 MAG: lactate utilization protein A [Chloroflexota bacterium]
MKKVALCVTCIVDQIMPEVGVATVKLLRRAGYEVEFPAAQTCCGQPFFNSGFAPQARDLAKRTIEIFEPYEAVVLPSGSCTTMMRVEYAHLLADDAAWHGRAQSLAAKTFELGEFLVQQAGWQPAPAASAPSVTYHDSCHMCRLLGLGGDSRQLLTAVGCTLHEMAEADRCCGFGGLFSLRMPEVSNAMTAVKLDNAAQTKADILVTADPGCLMQMRGLAAENQHVEHLATVLAAALENQ